MENIKTIDIFGNYQFNTIKDKENNNKNATNKYKYFPKIDINTGLNNNQLQSDSVLIHRLLQKKLTNNLDKNIRKFIKILINEMQSKTGNCDINIITRDTLLEYYTR